MPLIRLPRQGFDKPVSISTPPLLVLGWAYYFEKHTYIRGCYRFTIPAMLPFTPLPIYNPDPRSMSESLSSEVTKVCMHAFGSLRLTRISRDGEAVSYATLRG